MILDVITTISTDTPGHTVPDRYMDLTIILGIRKSLPIAKLQMHKYTHLIGADSFAIFKLEMNWQN